MKQVRVNVRGVRSAGISESTRSRQLRLLSLAACVAGASLAKSALAATETWTGLTDVKWADANWAPAGHTPGTGDTAVFNNAGNANAYVDLGAGVTISNILFDTANAAAYNIGIGAIGSETLILNNGGSITVNPSVANNQTFSSAITLGTDQTAQTYTVTNNSTDPLAFLGNITGATGTGTVGVKTIAVGGIGNTTISGNLLFGAAAADLAVTKNGPGILTLSGTNNFTGVTTINGGTLELDYTGATAPTNNIIAAGSALKMNGGTLLINGNATTANSQTFNGVTFNTGASVINLANNGTSPTLVLGGITNYGYDPVQFSATGTITTTAASDGAGPKGILWNNYATYGTSDWATTDTTAGAAGTGTPQIIGLSSVSGGYTTTMGGTGQGINLDLQANYVGAGSGHNVGSQTIRFNTPGATTVNVNGGWVIIQAVLVTPNMGANNATIGNGNWFSAYNTTAATEWITQNNTSAYFVIGSLINDKGGGGALTYEQSGPGTVQMPWTSTTSGGAVNSANQYTGQSYLNGGATLIKVDADLGAPASFAAVNLDGGSVVGDATVTLDNGTSATARPITVGTNGGGLAAANGFNMTVDGVISGAGTLTIGIPASSANGNTAGLLPGSGAGTANTTAVMGTGTVTLSSTGNTFSGGAIITGGAILNINSEWALGGSNYTGLTFASTGGGTLQYASTLLNATTDITQNSAATPVAQPVLLAGPATIDTNGHAITYANSFGAGGAGSLTVKSTTAGGVLTLNNTTFTGGVTVNSGGLILNGTNAYTGATTVNGGTLTINSTATLGNTAITVGNGGTAVFKTGANNMVIGTTGASLNLAAGSVFSMADGSIGTLTLNAVGGGSGTVLALPAAAGTGSMVLDLSSAGADQIVANNGVVSAPGGTEYITLNASGGTVPSSLTNIPLITVPNGSTLNAENFILSTPSVTFGTSSFTTSLTETGSALYLNLTAAKLTYYWNGGSGTWQTLGNFTSDAAGTTPQSFALSGTSNVIETANSPVGNYTQTLDGNVAIDNLEFTGGSTGAATHPITIAPGSGTPGATLTLNPTAAFTDPASGNNYPVGTGLIVQSGSAAHTISANIVLGMSQTWEIDNAAANAITLSGSISDGGSGWGITKTGVGGLILSGSSNTYSGLTTVSNGVVTAASNSALGSSTATTAGLLLNPVASTTATVNFNSAAPAIASLASSGAGTSNIVLGNATAPSATTLTIGGNNASTTFNGTISDVSSTNPAAIGSLTKIGSGTLALTGVNTYTGQTNISGGVVQINSASSLGNASAGTNSIVLNAATLDSTGGTYSLGLNRTIAVTGTGTLEVDAGALTINGVISDGTPPANITKTGAGTLVLAGSNTYTGQTNLNGGVTQISASANLGNASAGTNTISINSGTLELTANAVDLGLNRNIALPGPATIQTDTNASLMVDGVISGAGALTKAGAGVLIFNGSNSYTGVTTINAGTLQIGNGGTTGSLGTNSVTDNAALVFNQSGAAVTVNNIISGTGSVQQVGSNTLTLGGANTFTGNFTQTAGTVIANVGEGSGNGPHPTSLGDSDTANRSVTVTNGTLTFVESNILGSGSAFAPANYASVSLTNSTLNLQAIDQNTGTSGNNTLGAVTLNGSTINLNTPGANGLYETMSLASSITVTGNASFINSTASGNSQGINLGNANGIATTGYQTTFNVSSTTGGTALGGTLPDLTINATLDNGNNNGTAINTGLIKTGAGTLELNAANTYAGTTTISAGSLVLGMGMQGTNTISGSLNTSSTIVDNGNLTINETGTVQQGNQFSSAPITGTGSFTQAGSGQTIFTAANTYSGPTLISGGSLQLGTGGSTGSLNTTSVITNNGNLTINRNNPFAQGVDISASPISGSGSLSIVGSSTVTLNAANTYSGGTSVTSGTLNVTNTTGSATGSGAVNLSNGSISGTGSIAGNVIQTGGTIAPGVGATLSIGGLNFSGGSLAFTLNGTAHTSSQISTGSAIFSGVPTISLSAVNTSGLANGQVFTLLTSTTPITDMGNLASLAATTIGRVTLVPSEFGTNSIIATVDGTSASLVWAGGVAGLGGTITGDGSTWDNTQTAGQSGNWNNAGNYDYFYDLDNVLFNEAGSPNHTVNLTATVSPGSVTVNCTSPYTLGGSGSIAGTGTLTVQAGTLNLNNSNGNSYTGGTNITAGATLATGYSNVMPAAGSVTLAGTLDLAGNSQTIGTLSDGGVATGVITNSGSSGATLTLGLSANSTFNGTIQDGTSQVSLTKQGTGTLALGGTNTYSGATSINGGVLQISSSANLGNASSSNGINIGPSATLELTGNSSVDLGSSRNINLNGSSTFQVDGTGTLIVDGTVNGSGPLIKTGSGTLVFTNSNNYNGATDVNAGVLSLQGGGGLGYSTPVIVASGAELQLSGGSITVGNVPLLTLNGSGVSGGGALHSVAGTNSYAANITLGSASQIDCDAGSTLALSGAISGAYSVSFGGTGTTTLSGASTFTGNINISSGTVIASRGNGAGGAPQATSVGESDTPNRTINVSNGGTLTLTSSSTLGAGSAFAPANYAAVSLANHATLNLDAMDQVGNTNGNNTVGTLTLNGSTVNLQAPGNSALYETLGLASSVTVTGNASTIASTANGNFQAINLGIGNPIAAGYQTTFNVGQTTGGTAAGGTSPDLTVSASLSNGDGANAIVSTGVLKTGAGTMQLSGVDTYTGLTSVTAGKLVLASAHAFPASTPLNVSTGATVQIAASSGNVSYVPTLSALNNSGTIDLTNNAMVIQNSSGTLATLSAEVKAGYNGVAWNGTSGSAGVILSSAAAADTTHLTAIGISTGLTSFQGAGGSVTVGAGDVVLKYTYYGDANLDGQVNSADYTRIDSGFLTGATGWQNGDFNYDGVINGSDYSLIDNAFNIQGAQLSAQVATATAQIAGGSGTASAVPEPTTLGLLGLGVMGLLGRRNRRRN
jgi:autotransporter-associated beta strand protein